LASLAPWGCFVVMWFLFFPFYALSLASLAPWGCFVVELGALMFWLSWAHLHQLLL
jgi:hypothetical protein